MPTLHLLLPTYRWGNYVRPYIGYLAIIIDRRAGAYAPLVSVGSDCIVFDTIVERMSADMFLDRPWSVGNNPMTAVQQFLSSLSNIESIASTRERLIFDIDSAIDHKLLISVAPHGDLRQVTSGLANI